MRYVVVSALVVLLAVVHPARSCELKILLSWDVSASMSDQEFEIQRLGTAEAFRHPRVQNAIALSRGGVAVALMQWAGPDEQFLSVSWTTLQSGRDARHFAGAIEQVERAFPESQGTAIGNGLRSAGDYLGAGPWHCSRTVLDISGDGATNVGIDTASEADMLAAVSVTINGLVFPGGSSKDIDPYMFYVRNVARGPSSFVMDVTTYTDFPMAMQRKLLREILPQLASAN